MASHKPASLSQEERAALYTVTRGTNKFTINLFKALVSNQSGNVFVSPLSVQMALALAYTGAKSNTAQELANLLSLPEMMEDTFLGYNSLMKSLQDPFLSIANGLFVDTSFGMKKKFQTRAKKYFLSLAEPVDFNTAVHKTCEYINSWVEEKTNKKFSQLLKPEALKGVTNFIILNAVHFKAGWHYSQTFNVENTKVQPFHVTKTKTVPVHMMNVERSMYNYKYDNDLKAQFLQIDYKRKDFNILIILPDEIDGLAAIEAKMDKTHIGEELRDMEYALVQVGLPKFKIQKSMDLSTILKSLGVQSMFNESADFSGLSDKFLYVNEVVQSAFIEVNETGTEATAVTCLAGGAGWFPTISDPTFIADHPFIFIIRFKEITLFIGRVTEPPIA